MPTQTVQNHQYRNEDMGEWRCIWTNLSVSRVKSLGQLGKVIIDGMVLKAPPISSQTLVKWDSVTLDSHKMIKKKHDELFFDITFGFFQLDMHGGIFHSCCSFTDTCSMGGRSESLSFSDSPGPNLSCWGMENRCWGGRRPTGDFLIGLELGGLHGILLGLHDLDDPLLGARVEGHGLRRRRVAHVLSRLQLLGCPHGQSSCHLALDELFQRLPSLLSCL